MTDPPRPFPRLTHGERITETLHAGEVDAIGTGWALTEEDGLWRQHSWGLDGDTIVETTTERLAYVGLRLEGERALHFARINR